MEKVKKLIFNSGLAEYLMNGMKSATAKIKDLKDYCLGIEVGLGTHGRKNIGGKVMEKAVESLLVKAQKNEINFLWILDGKGLKSCKGLLKDTYLKVISKKLYKILKKW
ncbi:MAG: Type II restriction enzyme MboI [Mycoplasmataceae bacterium RC_NB112A]|nr:MAG: Type II restriction enzyme MboI [Mycoplasmataceae bacterium RC_NB112A]KLL01916.1 MAG: Type II restriction enzyme MboI [Mycoplasmataceae bacterium RC_NB112A]